MDNALRAYGYYGFFGMEERVGKKRSKSGARRIRFATLLKYYLVNYFFWITEPGLGACKHHYPLDCDRLDNDCLLQNFKTGSVFTFAVYPLGKLRLVSELFDLDA